MTANSTTSTLYMTTQDEEYFSFNPAFKQIWTQGKRPSLRRSSNESVALHFFSEFTSEEKDVALEILLHIKDFGYSTESQIRQILNLRSLDTEIFASLVDKMYRSNFLNYFILGTTIAEMNFKDSGFPEDALRIFCIDVAGNKILTELDGSHHQIWLPRDTICLRSDIIIKQLSTVRYALNLYHFKQENVLEFTPRADFDINFRMIRCSARFTIEDKGQKKEFLFESVRNNEVPALWRKKVTEQLKPLTKPNDKTGKYDFYRAEGFYSVPKLVILAEDDTLLLDIADIYYKSTDNVNFFMTTDGEIGKKDKAPKYWMYTPPEEKDLLADEFAKGSLKPGTIPTFSKKT